MHEVDQLKLIDLTTIDGQLKSLNYTSPQASYKPNVTSQSESNITATYILQWELFSVSKWGIWNI